MGVEEEEMLHQEGATVTGRPQEPRLQGGASGKEVSEGAIWLHVPVP